MPARSSSSCKRKGRGGANPLPVGSCPQTASPRVTNWGRREGEQTTVRPGGENMGKLCLIQGVKKKGGALRCLSSAAPHTLELEHSISGSRRGSSKVPNNSSCFNSGSPSSRLKPPKTIPAEATDHPAARVPKGNVTADSTNPMSTRGDGSVTLPLKGFFHLHQKSSPKWGWKTTLKPF